MDCGRQLTVTLAFGGRRSWVSAVIGYRSSPSNAVTEMTADRHGGPSARTDDRPMPLAVRLSVPELCRVTRETQVLTDSKLESINFLPLIIS